MAKNEPNRPGDVKTGPVTKTPAEEKAVPLLSCHSLPLLQNQLCPTRTEAIWS